MDCINCGCYDSDAEGCTLPAVDLIYACPHEIEKEETMITNVEIKPNGDIYVYYGSNRCRLYLAGQPIPQTVKKFMNSKKFKMTQAGK